MDILVQEERVILCKRVMGFRSGGACSARTDSVYLQYSHDMIWTHVFLRESLMSQNNLGGFAQHLSHGPS